VAHVWCPGGEAPLASKEEWVHRQVHGFGLRGLCQIGRSLNRFARPRKLLVQWVPHGYGWRAMNVPFCLWVLFRAWKGDEVQIMFHEAFLPFRDGTWRQYLAAAVQRVMTMILFRSTRRVWVSSPLWKPKIAPYSLGKDIRFTWLPVPSTIPVSATTESVADLRSYYTPNGEPLIGHFGTYGRLMTEMLEQIVPQVLASNTNYRLLLIGSNSDLYRESFVGRYPEFAARIFATGTSNARGISRSLMVCDLMVQPYPDGVNGRRTSCLAGLSHGKPVVTTSGQMTEDFWHVIPNPVVFGADGKETASITRQLLDDRNELQKLGERARNHYRENFALEHLLRMLQLDGSQSNEC
jgi:glycosyltransferase involved in cell wall biosynthesis